MTYDIVATNDFAKIFAVLKQGKHCIRRRYFRAMSGTARNETLFTKRRFLQVDNNEDKVVRLVQKDVSSNSGRTPRKLIRLIPVRLNDLRHSVDDLIAQPRNETLNRIAIALEQVANISEQYKTSIDRMVDEKSTKKQECCHDSHDFTAKKPGVDNDHQLPYPAPSQEAMVYVKESIELLLNGQHGIGSRLDGIQKEQVENRQQLEEVLKSIVEELKAKMVHKDLEHSVELEKMKIKQEHLYDNFNLLNFRLGEMEQLVSKLMQQSDETAEVMRDQKPTDPTKIEELALSDDSIHSVLSISSGSPTEGPVGYVKKTRKPSQAFIFSQRLSDDANKSATRERVDTIHF